MEANSQPAAVIELADDEVRELEELADSLQNNAIRFWEKVMD